MQFKFPWTKRQGDDPARVEKKAGTPGFIALHLSGEARWTRRDYAALAREGYMQQRGGAPRPCA